MNKANGVLNLSHDGIWGPSHPDVTITITSSHGGAISVETTGSDTYEYNGGNTIKLHGTGGGNATITCAATEYYNAITKYVIWYTPVS